MPRNKILVIDEDQDFRERLSDFLSSRGFSMRITGSGTEALWLLSQQKPDLIILDLVSTETSGLRVCRLIKSDPSFSDILVFILTTKDDLQTKIDCFQMGVEEYLLKPIELEELTARIIRFLAFADRFKPLTPTDEGTMTMDGSKTVNMGKETSPKPVTVTARRNSLPVEKSKFGSYRVERLAGKGGMGQVYKAYDEQLERFVALKVLAKQWTDSAEFIARFRREAKLIAAITHPGIAQIYSLGEEQGEYFFALLWCPGGSLRDLIRNQRTIGLTRAVEIILQCARALAAAWQKGVVHRDVKPSNIMFDEDQHIKLVDFGIAHSEKLSSQLTTAQEILGSPAYMAPEQGRAEKVDHRTDIYGLGMTFYQILTGELPFSAQSPVEWMIKHATAPFPTYQQVEGKLPQKAFRIIEKMARKKPSDRYQSYSDLITDLETVQTEMFRECQFKVPSAARIAQRPSLKGDRLFDVLTELVRNERSGILTTTWGPLEKTFYILEGNAVLFESPQSEENVWKKLEEKGILVPGQVSVDNPNLEETLNRLLFLQALSLDDFTSCYRQVMKNALLEVFQWPVADVEFFNAEITQDTFCKLSLATLVMEAARSSIDYEMIKDRVPPDRFILRTSTFDRIFSMLELPATESFLASRIEGESVTLEVLQLLTGFQPEQITRFIYALEGFDAVEYRLERPISGRRRTSSESMRSGVTPTPADLRKSSPTAKG